MNKPNKTNDGFQKAAESAIKSFTVSHVRQSKSGVYFSLEVNGVNINGCRVVESKNGDFISLPQFKGTDGKYHYIVFVSYTDEDQKAIISEVERQLNA